MIQDRVVPFEEGANNAGSGKYKEEHKMPVSSSASWTSVILGHEFVTENSKLYLKLRLKNAFPQGYVVDNYVNNNILCIKNHPLGGVWRIASISSDGVLCKTTKNRNDDKVDDRDNTDALVRKFEWEMEPSTDDRTSNMMIRKLAVDPRQPAYAFLATAIHIHARVTWVSLGNIDTVQQIFQAATYTELYLKGMCQDHNKQYVAEFLEIAELIESINFMGVEEEKDKEIIFAMTPTQRARIPAFDYIVKIKHSATFYQPMELSMFPFDFPFLQVCLTLDKPTTAFNLIEETADMRKSRFLVERFKLHSVFTVVHGDSVQCEVRNSDKNESSSGFQYPRIYFALKLKRVPAYYVSNTMVPTGLLSIMSVISFGVNEDGSRMAMSDRLDIALSLLLAAISYKFIVNSSLPLLPYSTILDWYVWFCFGFILLVVIECVVFPAILSSYESIHSEDLFADTEKYVCAGLVILFVFVNVLLVAYVNLFVSSNMHSNNVNKRR
jgi:hypothetical protein